MDSVEKPITLNSLLQEFQDVFEGLGKFPEAYHIQTKLEVEPVIQPPHQVPHSLYDRLKHKLDDMEKNDVIAKVECPTDWVNNIVVVEKKGGDLQICLDPKDLNLAIRREHFQIPTYEDVVSHLGGKRFFTILDQKDSYWQVPLSEESSYLYTFSSPFSRYRFLRMPFGICSASGVLQKRTYKSFGDIDGVHVIADDMIITSESEEEHDQILCKWLARARQHNIKLNPKKIQLKSEVVYMGNILTEHGVKPDEMKVKAVVDMPTPISKEDVRRQIGMLNYLSPYISNMSEITIPIRSLLKNNVQFQWLPEHSLAFDKIKEVLTSDPVLLFYDPNKAVTIQCDAL